MSFLGPARETRGSYQEKGGTYMAGARGEHLDAVSYGRLFAPHGGYSSAELALAVASFFATFSKRPSVVA